MIKRKITLNIHNEEITDDIVSTIVKELPVTGLTVWKFPNFGRVVVSKKDYRKTDIYDVYIDHRFDEENKS